MKPKGISVIICTYNGKGTIEQTLTHLNEQVTTFSFEIVLVDNASTDGTSEIAQKWWEKNGNKTIGFLLLHEDQPGKTFAQKLGFRQGQYRYHLVCDDDNFLGSDYLQLAFDFLEENPQVGVVGGHGIPISDMEVPIWFSQFQDMYAVGSQKPDGSGICGHVYGAGSLLRSDVWQKMMEMGIDPLLTCRKGNELSSGGDNEMCYLFRCAGYEIYYHQALKFHHFIQSGRFSIDYLVKLRLGYVAAYETLWSYLTYFRNGRIKRNKTVLIKEFVRSLMALAVLLPVTPFRPSSDFNFKLRIVYHKGRLSEIIRHSEKYSQIHNSVEKNIQLASSLKQ